MADPQYTPEMLQIIEALMDMVEQYFRKYNSGTLKHNCLSAEENAITILCTTGFAKIFEEDKNSYTLNWNKLQQLQHGNKYDNPELLKDSK